MILSSPRWAVPEADMVVADEATVVVVAMVVAEDTVEAVVEVDMAEAEAVLATEDISQDPILPP